MAIEDAVVLAYALSNAPTIGEALAVYERERVAPTSAIVVLSRRFGQIGQWRNRAAVWLRNVMIRLTPDRVLRSQLLKQAAFTLPDERP
jgi:2-polyprenyl-6-methoxyphenol hydroxylase-like FAD-dependent oxidoreductase